jgi:hypothetical protein
MTIAVTDYLRRQIDIARWIMYPIMAVAGIAGIVSMHFKAVCGVDCCWTHGGLVFGLRLGLAATVCAILVALFKCPACRANLKPDSAGKKFVSLPPRCSAQSWMVKPR